MEKFKDLIEKIETMSVLELHELVKALEEKFGVSAQAVAAPPPPPPPAGEGKERGRPIRLAFPRREEKKESYRAGSGGGRSGRLLTSALWGCILLYMKNYSLFSLVFAFILLGLFNNASYVSAFNCAPGELFNTATGQPCNTTIIIAECSVGDLFSSVTGKRCDQMQPNNFSLTVSEKFNNLFKPNFKVGMKGNEVKALQQLLKDE